MSKKFILAPLIASITSIILAILKFILGFYSSSMSVLSSSMDSLMDSIVSILNYFALKKSKEKANVRFNYGYDKIESLMSFTEGLLIIGVGIFIFLGGIDKIIHPEHNLDFNIALFVMVLSLIVVGGLIIYFSKILKSTNSLVIKADLLNFKSDFLTNLGIIVALFIIKITNWVWIDGLIAVSVSVYITISAIKIVKKSAIILLDGAVSEKIIDKIIDKIKSDPNIVSFHNLRTREGVNIYFLDADLVFKKGISLQDAHNAAKHIEEYIKETFDSNPWIINFHFDPVDDLNEQINVINNVSF